MKRGRKNSESPSVPNPERGIRPGMDAGPVHSPSCSRGSFHAGFGILKNHATVGDAPGVSLPSKHVRSRFAMLHLIRRQNHIKRPESPAAARVRDAPVMALPVAIALGRLPGNALNSTTSRIGCMPSFPAFPNKCGACPQLWTPHPCAYRTVHLKTHHIIGGSSAAE